MQIFGIYCQYNIYNYLHKPKWVPVRPVYWLYFLASLNSEMTGLFLETRYIFTDLSEHIFSWN